MIKLCECGCGKPTNYFRGKYNKFIVGHWAKSEKGRKKLCADKSNRFKKGNISWNEGNGKKRFEELKQKNKNRLCKCGCGQKIIIKYFHIYQGVPNFILGHGKEGNKFCLGKQNALGYKPTKEARDKMSKFHLGKATWNKSKKCPQMSGKNSGAWKGGITPLHASIRNLLEYAQWRKAIFERDNFTCQICKKSKNKNINVHHIKPFQDIFQEFLQKYKQFSPVKDKNKLISLAIEYKPFWNADGITVCIKCHNKKHTKRHK